MGGLSAEVFIVTLPQQNLITKVPSSKINKISQIVLKLKILPKSKNHIVLRPLYMLSNTPIFWVNNFSVHECVLNWNTCGQGNFSYILYIALIATTYLICRRNAEITCWHQFLFDCRNSNDLNKDRIPNIFSFAQCTLFVQYSQTKKNNIQMHKNNSNRRDSFSSK